MTSVSALLLEPVKPMLNFGDKHRIDNTVFSLHYRLTVAFILVCSMLVTEKTFFGDPIDCVVQTVPQEVMDTYCWIHATFTMPRRIENRSDPHSAVTAHPGVGQQHEDEEATYHKYYQFVCFTLFFQALCFYLPRWLWIMLEGKRMQRLINNDLLIETTDKRVRNFPKPHTVVGKKGTEKHVEAMIAVFDPSKKRPTKQAFNIYFRRFLVCEVLNLVNVILQVVLINVFLGYTFTTYGTRVWDIANLDPEDRYDPMNVIFPKVAKCTFKKNGPSGTIQKFDGLCVLPVNIINEKIYIFLWYWLFLLTIITSIYMCYRLLTIFSCVVRQWLLRSRAHMLVGKDVIRRLCQRLSVGEWFFLCQVGWNIDPHIFAVMLNKLDKCWEQFLGAHPSNMPNGHGGTHLSTDHGTLA